MKTEFELRRRIWLGLQIQTTFIKVMEIDLEISDEEYVIERAKESFKKNPSAAKAWILTAKIMYPYNFEVQFEAFKMEKNARNVKEAAKCFSELTVKFQQEQELWKEIERLTIAIRESDNKNNDPETDFLCEMFRHLSSDVQYKLLLFTADRCEDTMEHCRLLLLLLQRFPTAISCYGATLVDTLISAEKHSINGNLPVNPYRKLLVCDLLPLLANEKVKKVDLPVKLLLKLLHKSMEFYFSYLGLNSIQDDEETPKIDDPWCSLFNVVDFIGTQLNWESSLYNFLDNFSKETYWQNIVSFCQNKSKNYPLEEKQLLFCLSIFFVYCLFEYNSSLMPESSPGQVPIKYLMVEAFSDSNLPTNFLVTETSKGKKRKSDQETTSITNFPTPCITVENPNLKHIQNNFLICMNCWDLFNSSETLQREFIKLNSNIKIDSLLSNFVIDYALYKGLYEESIIFLHKITDSNLLLQRYIRETGILFHKKTFSYCLEPITLALPLLSTIETEGKLSTSLIIRGNSKHLHYLPLTKLNILQYLVKLLIRCIKETRNFTDLAIGHIFTLTQLDWPQEEDFIPPLLDKIKQNRSFQYHLFQNYIINVDILEELSYLWTSQGGGVQLDLLPHLGGQRRIGTRGADKGVKEEIKQAIRRQILRSSNEKFQDLLVGFILNERSLLLQVFNKQIGGPFGM